MTISILLSVLLGAAGTVLAAPQARSTPPACRPDSNDSACSPDAFGTLPSAYTLTAIKTREDPRHYNGAKVQNFGLFVEKVGSYCPFTGDQASLCPNGTDMALSGTMHPLSLVPGGQDLYVTYDGQILITTQHSHYFPPNSYPYYYGWSWTPLRLRPGTPVPNCPLDNPKYNCERPTGFWTFRAPNATVGGLRACPNIYNPEATSVYAVTPGFNRTDCDVLDGLGTHNYTGPNPPVWAY